MPQTDSRLLLLNQNDNILVLRAAIDEGEIIIVSGTRIEMNSRIGLGHKLSRVAIKAGDKVLKYGAPIGSATRDIAIGEHVHLENLQSDYTPTYSLETARAKFGSKS